MGKTIGARVREARLRANLSIEQLAGECDVATGTIGNLERGVTKRIDIGLVRKIEQVTGANLMQISDES